MKDNDGTRYIQRSSIFRTQCKCRGKVCKVVVSSGILTNLILREMISKLNIEKIVHCTPYRMYGRNNYQWIDVKEKAYMSFNIGRYVDKILCDVVPLDDCHMIQGRKWQVDVKAIHCGWKNEYVIKKDGKKFVMSSLQDDNKTWGISRSQFFGRREFLKHKEHEDEEAKVKSPFEGQEDKRKWQMS